jgi:competence protein ComEA
MKKNKSEYELRQGRRLLVLLLLGLIVANFSIHTHDRTAQAEHRAKVRDELIWVDAGKDDFRQGVWQVPEKTTLFELLGYLDLDCPATHDNRDLKLKPFSTLFSHSGRTDLQSDIHPRLASLVFQPIPLNRADAQTLTTLNGIGPSLAKKIVRFREGIGKYNTVEQLLEIKGVGQKTVESLRGQISVD